MSTKSTAPEASIVQVFTQLRRDKMPPLLPAWDQRVRRLAGHPHPPQQETVAQARKYYERALELNLGETTLPKPS